MTSGESPGGMSNKVDSANGDVPNGKFAGGDKGARGGKGGEKGYGGSQDGYRRSPNKMPYPNMEELAGSVKAGQRA